VLWGWSGGAAFSSSFAQLHPERVAAFIRYHIHRRGVPLNLGIVGSIPALIMAGGKDQTAGVEDAQELWKSGRAVGAPWTFAIEADAPHGPSGEMLLQSCHDLIIPWIGGVLRQRLAADGYTLRRIPSGSGWFANNQTTEIASSADFVGKTTEASWLPDEAAARGWRTLIRGAR